jgi:hypothetical protein
MAEASTPSTVTEAVAQLRGAGYTDDVELRDGGLACERTHTSYPLEQAIVDHTFRFEGDSDPGDEAIVLGLRYPDAGIKAILVSAFGPGADPVTAEYLARLHQR